MPDQQPNNAELPIAIDDDETIVRAILTPWHINKKGDVKWQALKPQAEKSDLSVMRQRMGDGFCKDKAVDIGNGVPKNEYHGLLTVRADSIRKHNAQVTDSRDQFLGHADLDYQIVVPANDPPLEGDYKTLVDRIRSLLALTVFHRDPAPNAAGWSGPALRLDAEPAPNS